jgi:2-C-methyl-D-erythritol 4-phosphate cytidylyltransferase|tara:strand:+ start:27778 stop:28458 length:681 start_codon:yes stop_codon:yes gene_type:complete
MKDLSVIITAGGIGKRMGGNYPKQFRLLSGFPVLMRTIQTFYSFAPNAQIIVTLPSEWKSEWMKLIEQYDFTIIHEIVDGGQERFHSIKNALAKCLGEKIMIHDGVRPLVSNETLQRGYDALEGHLGAIPFLGLVDSLRCVEGDKNHAVNRAEYKIIQTPQCFRKNEILNAYEVNFTDSFTDDASVFEAAGFTLFLFPGNEENLKITTEKDLHLTEFWWTQQKGNS